MRRLLVAAFLCCVASVVQAQQLVQPCYYVTSSQCQVVSGANPLPVSGTFSGSVTVSNVTIGAGGVVSGAYLDGSIITLGNTADARSTATDTTPVSIMQVLKEISFLAQNPAPITTTNAANGSTGAAVPLTATYIGINTSGNLVGWTGQVTQPDIISSTNSLALNAANTLTITTNSINTLGFGITGLSATGATITLEASDDGGTTWVSANCLVASTGGLSSNFSSNNSCRTNAAGRTNMRWRVSSTGSGTANIAYVASVRSGITALSTPLPAGQNTIGAVNLASSITGGCTPGKTLSAATTNSTNIKNSAGTLCKLVVVNTISPVALAFLKMYDTAAAPTCNASTVVASYAIPYGANVSGGGVAIPLGSFGEAYSNGISFCLTGAIADNDNTASVTGVTISYSYK